MTALWRTVALGEVLREERNRVDVEPDRAYRIAGVLIAGQGLFWRDTIEGSATKYATLYRLRARQLVYRKLTAWEGPITVVPDEFDGAYVSAEFPTFTLDESQLLPEFLRCICQQPSFHDEMRMRSTGTAERRNRITPDDLLEIEVALPPIEEQRAIVGVVRKFESHRALAAHAARAAHGLLTAARERLLGQIEESQPLRTVVQRFEAGSSPKCLDRAPFGDEWAVLKTSAVRPGLFRADEAKALPVDSPPRVGAEVRAGDVVTIRASGSRHLVGAFCRVEATPPRRLLSDYHWRTHLQQDRVDPDYLVEAMATQDVRSQIEESTTGSTTAGKISQASMLELEIPLPNSVQEQRNIAATLRRIRLAATAYEQEALAVEQVRRTALDELLSSERTVLSP